MADITMPPLTPKKPVQGAFYGLSGYGAYRGGSSLEAYRGLITTTSADGSGYAQYRKTGTAGFFVNVPIEDADVFVIKLLEGTDYLYTLETEVNGVMWKLNRNDPTNSGASQGYYYFVSPADDNINTVYFELQDDDTLAAFTILDEETYIIVGNEFFSPNFWVTFDKTRNPITFGTA